jgi:hypothetical protein
MSQFLQRRFNEQGWLQPDPAARLTSPLGIVMRAEDTDGEEEDTKYIAKPETVDSDLRAISEQLGLAIVFTMSSDITALVFKRVGPNDSEITLSPNNITVPVVESLKSLASDPSNVRRRDFCCFVRQEKVVLVWSNSVDEVLLHASDVETKLMSSVCFSRDNVERKSFHKREIC